MKTYLLAALAVIAFACPALADTTVVAPAASTVTVPYGDWINELASVLTVVAGAVVTVGVPFLLRFVPAGIRAFITQAQIAQAEQLLSAGIGFGINQVAGATKGQKLEVNVGNAVVTEAANYVIQHGPEWLIDWMGGPDMIEQKILARLDLVPAATAPAAAVVQAAPVPQPAPAPAPLVVPAAAAAPAA